MDYKYELLTLNFDVTRRCNLRCKFCSRGEAQNQDITPEVIDATLDQMKDVYIANLRLSGGEPLLMPDAIEYIVDGIIARQLAIYNVGVFTNGSAVVRNPKIAKALERLANYLEHRTDIKHRRWSNSHYTIRKNKRIAIIVSEAFHAVSNDERKATIDYYNGVHPLVGADTQNHSFLGTNECITIEGLARENIRELVNTFKICERKIRRIDDKYCFMAYVFGEDDMPAVKIITKSISISTNGHVFAGCLMPYERVDTEWGFDIRSGDLFEWIENFCWQHPVSGCMNDIRELYLALKVCEENGIEGTKDFSVAARALVCYIDFFEETCRELHAEYPYCGPQEIQLGGYAKLLNELETMKFSQARMQRILLEFAGDMLFNREMIPSLLSAQGRAKILAALDTTNSTRRQAYRNKVREQTADDMDAIRAVWTQQSENKCSED